MDGSLPSYEAAMREARAYLRRRDLSSQEEIPLYFAWQRLYAAANANLSTDFLQETRAELRARQEARLAPRRGIPPPLFTSFDKARRTSAQASAFLRAGTSSDAAIEMMARRYRREAEKLRSSRAKLLSSLDDAEKLMKKAKRHKSPLQEVEELLGSIESGEGGLSDTDDPLLAKTLKGKSARSMAAKRMKKTMRQQNAAELDSDDQFDISKVLPKSKARVSTVGKLGSSGDESEDEIGVGINPAKAAALRRPGLSKSNLAATPSFPTDANVAAFSARVADWRMPPDIDRASSAPELSQKKTALKSTTSGKHLSGANELRESVPVESEGANRTLETSSGTSGLGVDDVDPDASFNVRDAHVSPMANRSMMREGVEKDTEAKMQAKGEQLIVSKDRGAKEGDDLPRGLSTTDPSSIDAQGSLSDINGNATQSSQFHQKLLQLSHAVGDMQVKIQGKQIEFTFTGALDDGSGGAESTKMSDRAEIRDSPSNDENEDSKRELPDKRRSPSKGSRKQFSKRNGEFQEVSDGRNSEAHRDNAINGQDVAAVNESSNRDIEGPNKSKCSTVEETSKTEHSQETSQRLSRKSSDSSGASREMKSQSTGRTVSTLSSQKNVEYDAQSFSDTSEDTGDDKRDDHGPLSNDESFAVERKNERSDIKHTERDHSGRRQPSTQNIQRTLAPKTDRLHTSRLSHNEHEEVPESQLARDKEVSDGGPGTQETRSRNDGSGGAESTKMSDRAEIRDSPSNDEDEDSKRELPDKRRSPSKGSRKQFSKRNGEFQEVSEGRNSEAHRDNAINGQDVAAVNESSNRDIEGPNKSKCSTVEETSKTEHSQETSQRLSRKSTDSSGASREMKSQSTGRTVSTLSSQKNVEYDAQSFSDTSEDTGDDKRDDHGPLSNDESFAVERKNERSDIKHTERDHSGRRQPSTQNIQRTLAPKTDRHRTSRPNHIEHEEAPESQLSSDEELSDGPDTPHERYHDPQRRPSKRKEARVLNDWQETRSDNDGKLVSSRSKTSRHDKRRYYLPDSSNNSGVTDQSDSDDQDELSSDETHRPSSSHRSRSRHSNKTHRQPTRSPRYSTRETSRRRVHLTPDIDSLPKRSKRNVGSKRESKSKSQTRSSKAAYKLPAGIVWPPGMEKECIARLGLDGHHPIAPPGLEHLVTKEQWGDYWTWLHWYSSWQMWYMKNGKKPKRKTDREKRRHRHEDENDSQDVEANYHKHDPHNANWWVDVGTSKHRHRQDRYH